MPKTLSLSFILCFLYTQRSGVYVAQCRDGDDDGTLYTQQRETEERRSARYNNAPSACMCVYTYIHERVKPRDSKLALWLACILTPLHFRPPARAARECSQSSLCVGGTVARARAQVHVDRSSCMHVPCIICYSPFIFPFLYRRLYRCYEYDPAAAAGCLRFVIVSSLVDVTVCM